MTPRQIQALLKRKERAAVEFKEAREAVPRSLFETVCAFLNRESGVILLGVDDDGKVTGVAPEAVGRLTADIVSLSNNPQKLDPPFILAPSVVEPSGKQVLVIQVPASSEIHRCVGVVYDRGNEGDFQVKDPKRIAGMVNRKSGFFSELKVYPHLRVRDLDAQALARARRLVQVRQPEHPWIELSDKEFLFKAGFWRGDPLTATEGYTLAAGLMFGKEEVIFQMLPHYRTDALVRRVNVDRYDDRVDVRTNLIDAYDQLMQFVAKHLPDPFFLEGDIRISLREKIFREVVSNTLAHREYLEPRPATFTIFRDRVEATNAAHEHGKGAIRPDRFSPYSKNPVICRFFRQMGRAEELGSGVINMNKYVPFYAKGAKPRFIEGNPFVTIVPLPSEAPREVSEKMSEKATQEAGKKGSEKSSEKIVALLTTDPALSARQIGRMLGLTSRAVEKHISQLQASGRLRRVGPDKGGHWKILNDQPDVVIGSKPK